MSFCRMPRWTGITSEDVAVEIDKEAFRGGINIIVVSEESKSLIFYGNDKKTMIERVWENMTGLTRRAVCGPCASRIVLI